MMKKFLAILLATMLVLVNVAALATSTDPNTTGSTPDSINPYTPGIEYEVTPTAGVTIVLPKVYTVNSTVAGAKLPSDTVSFEVTGSSVEEAASVTTAPPITISTVTIDEATSGAPVDGKYSYDITVTLPAYTDVGIYKYTIKESDNDVAGIEYMPENIYLKITVQRVTVEDKETGTKKDVLQLAGVAFRTEANDKNEDGTINTENKIDKFENTYTAGSLTVSKKVTGNMGDETKPFEITVTFTSDKVVKGTISYTLPGETTATTIAPAAWTGSAGNYTANAIINLKHGESVKFDNIPKGVKWEITEKDYTANAKETADKLGYDAAVITDASGATGITAATTYTAEVKNNKNVDVDTGIALETMPFVLLMGIALVGVVALRRREEY